MIEVSRNLGVAINTELSLIQQEYAYDQPDPNNALINVYLTITIAKTFIISIDFMNYPEKPKISFPDEIINLLGDTKESLTIMKNWDSNKPLHILDILHEIEKKLLFIKEIETQSKKIAGEYQCESIPNNLTVLKVHLLTYGFKEYSMDVDLESYPKPPLVMLASELEEIIQKPITELNTYKNWQENETEPIDIIREISWLLDKNSRINFEIALLKDHYQNIRYEPTTAVLYLEMKGKMRTEDLTFEFQVNLPREYPMKMPEVKVINKFELEAHEKIKSDLHNSFNDFFDEWTPFSYLVDLFNLISKKIFEVSVVSCVICHKIECPSCAKKIAGEDNCHAECPHCNRAYHKHCWEQTIKSFGKCGFCLR
jgi:ubiquitin-protein ligase